MVKTCAKCGRELGFLNLFSYKGKRYCASCSIDIAIAKENNTDKCARCGEELFKQGVKWLAFKDNVYCYNCYNKIINEKNEDYKVYEDYKEIVAESFWGVIASLVFFQIFGYMVFQSFITYFENPFMLFYGSTILLVFLFFQSKMMEKIRDCFSKKSLKTATLSLRQKDDLLKFFLTIIFIAILILFLLGYYPFPKSEYDLLKLIAFYIFSIVITYIFSIKIQKIKPEYRDLKYQGSPLAGVAIGAFFVILGYFFNKYGTDTGYFNFYIAGIPGMGIIMMCLTTWLFEDQIK